MQAPEMIYTPLLDIDHLRPTAASQPKLPLFAQTSRDKCAQKNSQTLPKQPQKWRPLTWNLEKLKKTGRNRISL